MTRRDRRAESPSQVVVDGVVWPVQGAQVAILDGSRVLLQLRPFPPGWELPGGHVELDLWQRQNRSTTAALRLEAAAVEAYLRAD